MRSLVDLQDAFARAMTTGEAADFDFELVGGAAPRNRLGVHLRHYDTSLTAALLDKFPACTWLLGGDAVRDAARAYVRRRPPSQPCIAEYGSDFPQFLAGHGGAAALPYVESFAALEWALGQASIATDRAPRSWEELASIGPDRLVDSTLVLQPGLRYRESRWRIDELMATYLRSSEPEQFALVEEHTCMEVHGTRGAVSLRRLDRAAFTFRAALAGGSSIGDAAAAALECDSAFDAGEALKSLAHCGLVTGASSIASESASC